jgi:D-alanyl-D-alanine carboxypeptidase (penicillin-binding protein 5/6)
VQRAAAVLAAVIFVLALLVATPASARTPRPSLATASAGIVMDARSGQTLLSKHPNAERSIASTTKLMTALLTLESGKLRDTFTAPPYDAAPAESQIHLRTGERMKVHDLLTALLLESANDAAADLAVGISGSRAAFVAKMNARARQLGLRHTHYANPIGLDSPQNYSTAHDLATLARKLLTNPRFARIVDRPQATLRSGDHPRTIHNRNLLVGRYPFVDGVKTGHTNHAGYILVGAAHGHGGRVVSVVLGEPSEAARDVDSLALLRWGIDQYHRVTLLRPGRTVAFATVDHHPGLRIRLTTRRAVSYTLLRGQHLTERVRAPQQLEGPIPAGRRVGSVDVRYAGHTVRTLGLVTTRAVPATSLVKRVTDSLGPLLTALALLLVVLGGVLAALRLRTFFTRRPKTVSSR